MPTPIDPPTKTAFKQSRFELRRKTGLSTSPFSGVQQAYVHPYALWAGTYTLPPMNKAQAAEWRAFFAKLQGRANTFHIGDPDAMQANGSVSGTATLNGAAAIGDTSIGISTTSVSGTKVFMAGDMIQLGTGSDARLYMITDNADTDVVGDCTVNIEPAIKLAVTDGSTVIHENPVGVFRLESDVSGWDANHMSIYGITFSCQEAL